VGQHEDVEQLGAGTGSEGVEAMPHSMFQFIWTHGRRVATQLGGCVDGSPFRRHSSRPGSRARNRGEPRSARKPEFSVSEVTRSH
jgi:hypothetical protein